MLEIRNIRFTNQSSLFIFRVFEKSGGLFGSFRALAGTTTALLDHLQEDDMGTITTSFRSEESIATGAAAVARRVAAVAGRLFVAWTNYKGLAMLSRMDERSLADIGLSRSDVRDALSRPWWEDPTEDLNARRSARRAPHRTVAPPLVPEPGFHRPRTDRHPRATV